MGKHKFQEAVGLHAVFRGHAVGLAHHLDVPADKQLLDTVKDELVDQGIVLLDPATCTRIGTNEESATELNQEFFVKKVSSCCMNNSLRFSSLSR